MKPLVEKRKYTLAISLTLLVFLGTYFPVYAAVMSDDICRVGDVLAPGESCTYYGTDTAFSVNSNGNGQFLFFSSGSKLNIKNTQINNVSYTLVAEKLSSGSWEIKELGTTAPSENTAPVFTEGDTTTRTVAENTATGIDIGTPVAATDTDTTDVLTYTLGGTDAASFSIVSTTGQLQTNAALDYATQSSYTVTVSVSDGNGGSDSITVTITVTGEDTPPIADGICRVGDVLAAGESCTYPSTDTEFSVNSNGNGQFLFFSSGSRLNIKDTQINNVSYTLVAEKLDSGSWEIKELGATAPPPATNNAPVFAEGASTTRTVAENTASSTNIGTTVAATDTDGDTLTYSLSGTDTAAFSIVSTSGQLQTNAALDYEMKSSYSVSVSVSDGKGGSDSISVTITVTDVSETGTPPVADGVCRIGDVLAAGESCTYPSTDTEFSVNSNGNGQFLFFSSGSRLNIRDTQINNVSYTLVAEKLNSGSWEIKELGATAPPPTTNNTPVFTDGTTTTRSVAENTASGTNIGTAVSATDADNDTLTYTLGGTDADSFTIVSTTGQLQTSAALDHETKSSYSVTVSVSDGKGGNDSIAVTITVTGGETPPVADGICRVGDVLAAGESCTYPGTDTEFSVNNNGNGQFLFFSSSSRLNIRDTQINNVSYTLVAEKLSSGSWEIKELGATAPPPNTAPVFTDGASTTRTVAENTASGVNIGSAVSATDADTDDTLTYTLGGTDAASFGIVSTSGQLQTNAALDYEMKSSYSVSVSVSDGNGGTDSISVTINITDIDETIPNRAPVFTEGNTATRSIAENTVPGANIGAAIAATDADGNTLTYSLGGTDAASFSIVSTSGQLQTRAALDYETQTSYSLTITVSDGTLTDSISVTINITDIDETIPNRAPVFTEGNTATRSIAENTVPGANIGAAIAATDADGNTLIYTLGGTDASAFRIVSTSGQLQTNAALDYEIKTIYSVSVSVSDGTLTDTISVTINITDIDETIPNRAPVFTEGNTATRSVAENTGTRVNIGAAIAATDADGNTLTYSLSGTGASAFRIDSSSGQIRTSSSLDYETQSSYILTVNVSDGSLTDFIDVRINVKDVNENAPVFTEGTSATRFVAENTVAGRNIGRAVAATDADTSDTLTYSLGGTDATSFSIVSTTGQLQTRAALDYGTKSSYSVTVSVSDSKGGTDRITVTIVIKEAIDPPLSQRTQQVRNAIVAAVQDVNNANNVTPAHLAVITSLTLSAKDITALKVDDFAGLTSLTHLYLVGNSISNISALKGLTSLTHLYLSENSISDISHLDDLTSLTHLYLSGNSISDISHLDDLTSLTHLYLSGNSISDISTLEDLTSLTNLDLSENSISDVSALEHLTSLRSLYIIENPISDYGPLRRLKTAIVNAGNTINMDINNKDPEFTDGDSTTRSIAENTEAGTNIGEPISATNVGTANTLTYSLGGTDAASFSINSISGQLQTKAALDYEIKQSYTVTVSVSNGNNGSDSITVTINITDVNEPITPVNERTQEVQDAIVAAVPGIDSADDVTAVHLAAITELDISGEYPTPGLTSLRSGDFSGLTSLTKLNLYDNSISNISPLAGLTSLTWLSLGYNSVTDISPLKNMTALTTLDLLDNSVTDISPLKNMTALTWLRLRENSISDISALKNMTALTILELSDNSVSDISALKNMTALTWLNLSSNSISDISALKKMTALTELNLHDNSISSISALAGLTKLTELNLYDNSVSDISALEDLTKLTILNLGHNSVSDISKLAGLTKLINIDMSYNSITDISKLEKLTLLTRLELNSNSITDISKLEKLTKLITLYLSDNSVTDISPLEHLTALETLNLSSNSISDISPLADLNLINLSLEDNSITDISAIEGLISLWTLTLSENTISDYAPLRRLIVAIGAYNGTLDHDLTIPEVPNNNAPVFTDGDSTTRSIAENTDTDTNIGDAVAATDADTTDTLTYYLGGTYASLFSIVRTSGQLKTKDALDYETETSYTVTVAVSDGQGGSDSITVTISVTDVAGEAPSVETSTAIPDDTVLLSNFPNPFNPETWIPYQLSKPAAVTLTIYDIRGAVVRELNLGHQAAGFYHSRSRAIHWDGRNMLGEKVATGVYFYTLKAGDYMATRKLLIRK